MQACSKSFNKGSNETEKVYDRIVPKKQDGNMTKVEPLWGQARYAINVDLNYNHGNSGAYPL